MNIQIGEKVVSIDDEVIKKALEENAESVSIESDLIIRTPEEQDSFLSNIKKESITTAFEMEVKKRRKELGLEFEGKNLDNLLNALTEKHKSEFTKDPSKKLEDRDNDIKLLQQQIKDKEEAYNTLMSDFTNHKHQSKRNNVYSSMIPENVILPKEDMITLMQTKIQSSFDEDGNLYFVGQDGNPRKDSNLNYLSPEKVAEEFFAENTSYLKQVSGGAGGSDSSGQSNTKSIESFNKRYEANGGQVGSMQYNQALNKAVISGDVEV